MDLVLLRTGDNVWEVSTGEDIEDNVIVTIMKVEDEWFIDYNQADEGLLSTYSPN